MINATELLAKAKEAAAAAHCPYSKFAVGAAAVWDDGSMDVGVNVENASSPLGVPVNAAKLPADLSAPPASRAHSNYSLF